MIQLFRAVYSRNGSAGGMTFGLRADLFAPAEAERFARNTVMPYARRLDPAAKLLVVIPVKSNGR